MPDAASGYQEHEVFTIPWVPYPRYLSLSLSRVSLEFRIQSTDKGYAIWCKQGKGKPWHIGTHRTIEEAKYRVYDQVIYFQLYRTGKWDRSSDLRLMVPE